MKRSNVEFHPAARTELLKAEAWYWARSEAAADAFLIEIERALDEIAETPATWPRFLHGTRRFLLHRFPFSVVYLQRGKSIRVVAVAHAKRRPGYWQRRTR